jgi:ankyrin repeat protein
LAAKNGHLEVVKYLYEQAGSVTSKTKASEAGIDEVARNGHLEVVEYLYKQGIKATQWAIDWTVENGRVVKRYATSKTT